MRSSGHMAMVMASCLALVATGPAWAQSEGVHAANVTAAAFDETVVPTPVAAPGGGPRPLAALQGAFIGLQALDVATTLTAVNRGHGEANPLMRGIAGRPAAMVAVKAGSTVATVWFVQRLAKRNRVAAVATMAALNGAYVAIVLHNARVNAR